MAGGGIGIAINESLCLMHSPIEMIQYRSVDFVTFVTEYVERVEEWRKVAKGIDVKQEVRKESHFFEDRILAKLKECYMSAGLEDKMKSKVLKRQTDGYQMGELNLNTYGQSINKVLQLDENKTCVVKLEEDFILTIKYEPNTENLYLSTLVLSLTQLPTDSGVRVALYEEVLQGATLGGQMAGGGVGISFSLNAMIMHCTLCMRAAKNTKLLHFAPLFIETVKKWKAMYQYRCVQLYNLYQ